MARPVRSVTAMAPSHVRRATPVNRRSSTSNWAMAPPATRCAGGLPRRGEQDDIHVAGAQPAGGHRRQAGGAYPVEFHPGGGNDRLHRPFELRQVEYVVGVAQHLADVLADDGLGLCQHVVCKACSRGEKLPIWVRSLARTPPVLRYTGSEMALALPLERFSHIVDRNGNYLQPLLPRSHVRGQGFILPRGEL